MQKYRYVSIFIDNIPITTAYNLAVDSWLLWNVGRTVTIYDIVELVRQAFDKSTLISKIKADFRKPGIYPYDRDTFHEDEFITHIMKKI